MIDRYKDINDVNIGDETSKGFVLEKPSIHVWNNCLKIIRGNLNYQSYKTWFEPIIPIKLENDVLTIQVPSQFFYEW